MGNIQESARRSAETAHAQALATTEARRELPGIFSTGLSALQKHSPEGPLRLTPFVELNGDHLVLSGKLFLDKTGISLRFSNLRVEAVFPTAGNTSSTLITLIGDGDNPPKIKKGEHYTVVEGDADYPEVVKEAKELIEGIAEKLNAGDTIK